MFDAGPTAPAEVGKTMLRTPPRSEIRRGKDWTGDASENKENAAVNLKSPGGETWEQTPAHPKSLTFSPQAFFNVFRRGTADSRDSTPKPIQPSRLLSDERLCGEAPAVEAATPAEASPAALEDSPVDMALYYTAKALPPARPPAPEPLITFSSEHGFALAPEGAQLLQQRGARAALVTIFGATHSGKSALIASGLFRAPIPSPPPPAPGAGVEVVMWLWNQPLEWTEHERAEAGPSAAGAGPILVAEASLGGAVDGGRVLALALLLSARVVYTGAALLDAARVQEPHPPPFCCPYPCPYCTLTGGVSTSPPTLPSVAPTRVPTVHSLDVARVQELLPIRALTTHVRAREGVGEVLRLCMPAPPPPFVLTGHAASLTPYKSDTLRPSPHTNRTHRVPRRTASASARCSRR